MRDRRGPSTVAAGPGGPAPGLRERVAGLCMVRLRRLPRFHVFGRSGLRPARPAGPRVEPRVLLKENVIIRVA